MYSSGEFNDNETLYMTRGGPLSIQRIECLLYTTACPYATPRGGRLLVQKEEGVSSLYRGESSPMFAVQEADSFYIQKGECLFLHKAESVPLLYVVEADYFYVQGKDCLLYTSERVSLSQVKTGHIPCLERGGSVFSVQKRDTPQIHFKYILNALDCNQKYQRYQRDQRYSFSVQRRECVLYTKERVSLCYLQRRQTPCLEREGSVISVKRRECVLYTGGRVYSSLYRG